MSLGLRVHRFGYRTVAAKAGYTLELFGVGFGPISPAVPAGKAYSGAAATTDSVQLRTNNGPLLPTLAGIVSAGLYQIDMVQVPSGLGVGDGPLVATVVSLDSVQRHSFLQ